MSFTAVCSGNQYEVRNQTISVASAGTYQLSFRYMAPERAVKAIVRIDGKSQTVNCSFSRNFQNQLVGSVELTAGSHTIGLSSGVDEGYICFDQVCIKPSSETVCTPPSAPVVSVSGSAQLCNGSSVNLTASGCSGTVSWSTGVTGSSLVVSTAGEYSATCSANGCSSPASNVVSVTACTPTTTPTTPTTPVVSTSSCVSFTAVCSGNQYEVRNQSISVTSAGTYQLSFRYMAPERAVKAIVRIDGKSQTVNCNLSRNFQNQLVGSVELKAGSHTIGLSSGVDEGYICFDQVCIKPSSETVCTPPSAPVVSVSGSAQLCNGSSVNLTASGCSGTVSWSTGVTGSSLVVSTAGEYSATCSANGCSSPASNVVSVTACTPTTTPTTPVVSTSSCVSFTAVCSGNQYEVRNQSISVTSAGTYQLSFRYMAPERAVKAIVRIDGKSQTVNCNLSRSFQNQLVGSVELKAGSHVIGLSSGVDEGYICFDQVCVKPSSETVCTPPSAPVVSVSGSAQLCNGSSVSLTASGCSGTVSWSTGVTGSSLVVSTAGEYSATCSANGCSSPASNVVSVTACTPTTTPTTPVVSTSSCVSFTAVCSGNQYEVRNQSVSVSSAGTYQLSFRYMAPERAVKAIVRIDGKSQTVNCNLSRSFQNQLVGSFELTAGNHVIGLSSGTEEGYICFDQVCIKPSSETVCTPPSAPVVSVSGSAQLCNGSSVSLTASGCSGTVSWSTGVTGSSLVVSTAGEYSATCSANGCSSPASNVVSVTACTPTTTPTTPVVSTSSCVSFTAVCSGNQYEVRNQSISVTSAGTYQLSFRYMASERAVKAIVRIDGKSQTVNCNLSRSFQNQLVGSFELTAGNHVIGLSSGTEEGYICFDQVCIKPSSETVCTPPSAPVVSVSGSAQLCNGSSVSLTASGCSGTVSWSTGVTGSSLVVSTAGEYSATCFANGCSSAASNTVYVTSCDLPKCAFTPKASASSTDLSCGASVNLSANCNGPDCDGVNYSWNGNGVAQYGQSATVNVPNSNGNFIYTVTASKLGCVAKKDTVTLRVTGCPELGVYSYRGDNFDYTAPGESSTDDAFPVFENDKIRVKLALRNQTTDSQQPGMGGAVYQIFNKQHNSTHTLLYNPNRYDGDENRVVDRSGPPRRIFLGQGLSECLYALPKPFYTNEFDGAAGSSYPVDGQNPPGYDGGLGFNPNEAGDDFMNSGQLLKFGRISSGFYTKTRPPIYGQNRLYVGDQVIFEKWGTLDDRALDLHYQSTFNRTSYAGRHVTKSQENPCLYVNGLRVFKWYDGDRPYSNDGVTTIAPETGPSNRNGVGKNGGRPNGVYLSEPWIWVGGTDGFGIGLMLKDNIKAAYGFWGDGGFDAANPSMGGTYASITSSPAEILDNNIIWRHTAKVIVGTVDEVRAYVYAQSYRPDRTPKFKFNRPGREGWSLNSGDGDDVHTWDDTFNGKSRQGWKVYLSNGAHAVMQSPGVCWETSQFNKFYIRYKYSGNQTKWSLKFQRNRQKSDGPLDLSNNNRFVDEDKVRFANGSADAPIQTVLFDVIPDGQWHTAIVDLSGNTAWQGVVSQISIKPHAYNDGRSYNSGEYCIIDWINSENRDPFPD
ncbi:hypothetical protein M0L20_05570 [Spirosoma sp. RP8]|uniref:Ig-like domain-containing protein n=1 Tax=Spirosoma liriopis TaxID=2937440 RepID=A0ABT0HGL5_9BACT|nr:hypothetical protein [Spirosoma liriopis]